MDFKLEIYNPSLTTTTVTEEELADVYPSLAGDTSPTIAWNEDGDQVIIVAIVDDTHSVVSLLSNSTWYYLVASSDDELVEVNLCGQESWVPQSAIVPRQLGLHVLLGADDVPRLLTEHSWVGQ